MPKMMRWFGRGAVPTVECPACGKEYAAACPACPYCDWIPLRPGRAAWQRTVFVGLGSVATVVVALFIRSRMRDAEVVGYTLAAGLFCTLVLANRLFGGGSDI